MLDLARVTLPAAKFPETTKFLVMDFNLRNQIDKLPSLYSLRGVKPFPLELELASLAQGLKEQKHDAERSRMGYVKK